MVRGITLIEPKHRICLWRSINFLEVIEWTIFRAAEHRRQNNTAVDFLILVSSSCLNLPRLRLKYEYIHGHLKPIPGPGVEVRTDRKLRSLNQPVSCR